MPMDPEALLISAVLKTKSAERALDLGVTADLFVEHRGAWEFIRGMWMKRGKVPSRHVFASRFPGVPLVAHDDVDTPAEDLVERAVREEMSKSMEKAVEHLEAGESQQALAVLAKGVRTSASRREMGKTLDVFSNWGESLKEVEGRVQNYAETGFAGVPSGIPTVDACTGGAQAGWLCIMAARLGVGKTWTTLAMAYEAAKAGHKVLYCSLEQSRIQIALRLHSLAAPDMGKQLDASDLVTGKLQNLDAYKALLSGLQENIPGSIIVTDPSRGRMTAESLGALVNVVQPSITFVDYMGLMGVGVDDWKGFGNLAGDCKLIAEATKTPLWLGAQVNRAGDGYEPPTAAELAESDRIGQAADLILTAARQQDPDIVRYRLAKFRHGRSGDLFYTDFRPWLGVLQEIDDSAATSRIQQWMDSSQRLNRAAAGVPVHDDSDDDDEDWEADD